MADTQDTATTNRRQFLRTSALLAGGLTLGASALGTASAAKPNFQAGFWGDGERWGTKAVADLPEPNNKDSLDRLFFIMDPRQDTPLSEAAPGNPNYNGGRWWSHVVTISGAMNSDFPITSDAQLHGLAGPSRPDVTVTMAEGGHDPVFFECPLLPYKG